jgi:hypothetical protein
MNLGETLSERLISGALTAASTTDDQPGTVVLMDDRVQRNTAYPTSVSAANRPDLTIIGWDVDDQKPHHRFLAACHGRRQGPSREEPNSASDGSTTLPAKATSFTSWRFLVNRLQGTKVRGPLGIGLPAFCRAAPELYAEKTGWMKGFTPISDLKRILNTTSRSSAYLWKWLLP